MFDSYSEEIILELRNEENEDMQNNINTVVEWLMKFKEKTSEKAQMMTS